MSFTLTFLTFAAACACVAYGQGFSDADKKAAVDAHNKARADQGASAMRKLKWNDKLAAVAAEVASKCNGGHMPQEFYQNKAGFKHVGENMYGAQGKPATVQAAVDNWMTEKSEYTGKYTPAAGHYTQVTWADTAEVGCATHKCPNGYTYVYCDYGEGGNMIGEPAFESGKPGSKCSSKYPGTKADDQGLCA